ncbi:hypothetical protein [Natronococcus wangiae]|uniref:hypothetical protein n=1 Tax=Natronococcus wangiae TaxID=3068275 RepID=UPI00273D54AE|nr:hypothetical protein [Natronococcus sp. AD5]
MVQYDVSKRVTEMSRRTTLITVIAVGSGAGAGCLDNTTESQRENNNGTDDSDKNGAEEARELAAEMVELIDDELSVINWELNGMFVPEYTESAGVEADIPILGDAYAEIVDQGFDRRAMPTALDEDGNVDFMVFLEPEWANAYLGGDWSEDEYYTEIEDSEH